MLYCAATISLCALEVLANNAALPKDMVSIAAETPDDIVPETLDPSKIPSDWNTPVPSASTKNIGTQWTLFGKSVAFIVPSVIVPDEKNVLINPAHPDFARINFSAPKTFVFDPRLK